MDCEVRLVDECIGPDLVFNSPGCDARNDRNNEIVKHAAANASNLEDRGRFGHAKAYRPGRNQTMPCVRRQAKRCPAYGRRALKTGSTQRIYRLSPVIDGLPQ